MSKVRYVYGITAALLIGGSLTNVAVGQPAQNEPGAIRAAPPGAGAPMSFASLAERLQPAVVNISTRQSVTIPRQRQLPPGFEEFFRRFGDQGRGGQGGQAPGGQGQGDEGVVQRGGSLGSGFIISADGYVVTNNHVVAPARGNAVVEEITVTLADRTEYVARVVGRDEASDLAVLKIDPRGALPFVHFGASDGVRVGDWVVAIGNPYALGGTVTAGIVSALQRSIGAGPYDSFIQTDASINQGNSGGPLFDLQGNVVGINTALYSPSGGNIGIGFAIPAGQAQPIVEALRRGQRFRRGYIGVSLQRIDEDLAEQLGVERNRGELITSVTLGGPAARAGVEQGDVVVTVGGRAVTPDETLSRLVSQQPIGSRVPIEVLRQGQRRTLTIAVAERPTEQELARINGVEPEGGAAGEDGKAEEEETGGAASARSSLGLSLRTLTPELARQGRLTGDVRGVVVVDLDPNSDAAQKGIQPGDIILSINRTLTVTPERAAQIVDAARRSGRSSILALVRRGNAPPRYYGLELQRPSR